MLGDPSVDRTFAQHALRRAAGAPVPAVLVGDDATRAWLASARERAIVRSASRAADEAAREYLAATAVRAALETALEGRVAAVRAANERTAFERAVWLAASRDALLAAGDLDAHTLLGVVFADEPPFDAMRALAAAARVLGPDAPPLLLTLGATDLDAAVRAAIAIAEAAPAVALAVATTPERWRAWLATRGREHAKAMVRPFVVEIAPTARPTTDAANVRALSERAKTTGTKDDDDEARSEAERLLFDALEADARSRGMFELNRRLDVKFGSRALEIDLACPARKLAIEIDGYFHFRELDRYRRDRRKDVVLQKERYFVMRFLAEDVATRLDAVVAEIHDALAFLQESKS